MNLKSSHLVTWFFLEAIALCLIISFRFINIASTATIFIFNLLFLSLTLPLNGSFNKKLCILALGNIAGLFWNFVLHYFSVTGIAFFLDQGFCCLRVFRGFNGDHYIGGNPSSYSHHVLAGFHRVEKAKRWWSSADNGGNS
jgi:hypothetical protein